MEDFRRFFLRGLGALVPTLLTIAIIVWAYNFVNDNVGGPITRGLRHLCSWISKEPAPGVIDPKVDPLRYGTPLNEWDKGRRLTVEQKVIENYNNLLSSKDLATTTERLLRQAEEAKNEALWQLAFTKYRLHLLGFLIAIIIVYFTGFFLASFLGRASWRAVEGLLCRVPLIRAIYPNVKQVTDFLLSERKVEFSGVVAVQYPRKGVWSLALRTGGPMEKVQRHASEALVTVFIPSSPTPVTGYVVQVPRSEVIELNMTIDEGLRFTISGGVIQPGAALPGLLPEGEEDSRPSGGGRGLEPGTEPTHSRKGEAHA